MIYIFYLQKTHFIYKYSYKHDIGTVIPIGVGKMII